MERRPKPVSPRSGRRVAQPSSREANAVNLRLPRIAEFLDYGQITLGEMDPVGGVAIANDGHNTLAMLARRDGETLAQLLTRLDQALAKALDEDIYTDEINPSS